MMIITTGTKVATMVWNEIDEAVETLREFLENVIDEYDEAYNIWAWQRDDIGKTFDEVEADEWLDDYIDELVDTEDRKFLKEHYGVMFKIY